MMLTPEDQLLLGIVAFCLIIIIGASFYISYRSRY